MLFHYERNLYLRVNSSVILQINAKQNIYPCENSYFIIFMTFYIFNLKKQQPSFVFNCTIFGTVKIEDKNY